MKISRERIEKICEASNALKASGERWAIQDSTWLEDALIALDERDELLGLCLDYINAHTKDEPLTWGIADLLRGTKWQEP